MQSQKAQDNTELARDIIRRGKKRLPRSEKKIFTEKLIAERLNNKTYKEIAQEYDLAPQNIWKRLVPYIDAIDNISIAKAKEGELYRFKAYEAISHITPDKLAKSSAYQLTLIASMMHDHAMKCEGTYKGDLDIALINIDLALINKEKELLYNKLKTVCSTQAHAGTPGGEKCDPLITSLCPAQGTEQGGCKINLHKQLHNGASERHVSDVYYSDGGDKSVVMPASDVPMRECVIQGVANPDKDALGPEDV